MGWFADERVGAVQARWGHLNRTWSWLTRAQAVVLDAFFMVEQEARDRAGFFLRFNGSAGIWRARTIADAGGWQADTLSEDYDLCLRAQLRGWKFVYARDVVAPAEVPVTVHDYKVQQTRWARGRGQVIRKLAPVIWRAPLPPLIKLHALFDMFNILVVPAVLLVVASSPWVVLAVAAHPALASLTGTIALLQAPLSLGVLPTYLWLAIRPYASRATPMRVELAIGVPAFLALMQGINLVVLSAGLSGLTGREVPFRRTSKYALTDVGDSWRAKLYRPAEVSAVTWAEGAVALCGVGALMLDVGFASWSWLPFHIVVTAGFSAMFGYSLVRS
jgi:cellulose synthase/poly-beta-1,6-N-acetylglucosamine synthase-like glycosyltransferase